MSKMKSGQKVVIQQVRSQIGRERSTDSALKALGLGRIGKQKTHTVNPALAGMIKRVGHLVTVKEV